ncbi:MAG: U32 family peptidase [Bacteroidales bacterium]|nr:U32 family peptidase [Bacteroidales bacterium]
MLSPRNTIELLSPAKNYECARAAILSGADAIYIGAPQFSARRVAANTVDDIRRTVELAHTYGVRVFVALNTILTDSELKEAVNIAWKMYDAKVDALIVQDMGLVEMELPPIELHASTQMDNRTVEKVQFLEKCGFQQVVLARELSLEQIEQIARKTQVRLECFIHGALCVSYSGQCYMSQSVNGRSANRGECAQPCRLKYDIVDKDGNTIVRQKHILSLKDQNQTENIERMIRAGASTLKIEGRLKDAGYVANVTLHYRRVIDEILKRHPEWQRASKGESIAAYEPNVSKSFNRGFTTYFMNSRQHDMNQPDTPKSIGEEIGRIADIRKDSFRIQTKIELNNGDGLCYRTQRGEYDGLRVNRAEEQWVFPLRMPKDITKGTVIRRNLDVAFEDKLTEDKTQRLIPIRIDVCFDKDGKVCVTCTDSDVISVYKKEISADIAKNAEMSMQNIIRQLSKLGQTPFTAQEVTVSADVAQMFFAASELNSLRREMIEHHIQQRLEHFHPDHFKFSPTDHRYVVESIGREGNIVNDKAKEFYQRHGCEMTEWGYERQTDYKGSRVMTTKYCIMDGLGMCLKKHPENRSKLPLTLIGENGKYDIVMNCALCEMNLIKK